MISDAFRNKTFYVNKLILLAFCQADAELNVLVYFDLETTDATNDIQICQISCIGPDNYL